MKTIALKKQTIFVFIKKNITVVKNSIDKKTKRDLEEFKQSPHFKLGMFTKMILNGMNFKKQIVSFFSKADKDLDIVGVDEAGDFMMFNRAYYWISEYGPRKKAWKEAINKKASKDFMFCLEVSLKYFEELEEFERCAKLKKIKDFTEKVLLEKENVTP